MIAAAPTSRFKSATMLSRRAMTARSGCGRIRCDMVGDSISSGPQSITPAPSPRHGGERVVPMSRAQGAVGPAGAAAAGVARGARAVRQAKAAGMGDFTAWFGPAEVAGEHGHAAGARGAPNAGTWPNALARGQRGWGHART